MIHAADMFPWCVPRNCTGSYALVDMLSGGLGRKRHDSQHWPTMNRPASTLGLQLQERFGLHLAAATVVSLLPCCCRYHDEEWGVPVREDTELFELLTLEGAQVRHA